MVPIAITSASVDFSPGAANGDFSRGSQKDFSRCGQSGEIAFYHTKLRNQLFF